MENVSVHWRQEWRDETPIANSMSTHTAHTFCPLIFSTI